MHVQPYWQGQIDFFSVRFQVTLFSALNAERTVLSYGAANFTDRVSYAAPCDLTISSVNYLKITECVAVDAIGPLYYDVPYFAIPSGDEDGPAYRVIHKALADTGKAGLGQLTVNGRERLYALKSYENGLVMHMLRYSDEIHDTAPYFTGIPIISSGKPEVSAARKLIRLKSTAFKPEKFHDHYRVALEEQASKPGTNAFVSEPDDDIHSIEEPLLEALQRSINRVKKSSTRKKNPFLSKFYVCLRVRF